MLLTQPSLIAPPLVILLLSSIRIFPFDTPTPHSTYRPLPLILPNNVLHAPDIMRRLAHVVQSSAPRSPLTPLHNFHAIHIRAVDLEPHLNANTRELVAEQNGGVDALAADVEAHAGEGIAAA